MVNVGVTPVVILSTTKRLAPVRASLALVPGNKGHQVALAPGRVTRTTEPAGCETALARKKLSGRFSNGTAADSYQGKEAISACLMANYALSTIDQRNRVKVYTRQRIYPSKSLKAEFVMKLAGHISDKSFQRYVNLTLSAWPRSLPIFVTCRAWMGYGGNFVC